MQEDNLIAANEFCLHHNIEVSFINSLQDYGLIEFTIIDDNPFIAASQLTELEKCSRANKQRCATCGASPASTWNDSSIARLDPSYRVWTLFLGLILGTLMETATICCDV